MPTVEEAPSLSKEELIQQGDAICAEVNAAVGTVNASEAETADQVSQAADLYSGMVERLKGLGTPEDDVGYAEFTEAADELAQAESDAQLASERGDEAALASAQSSASSALTAFEEAASAYGFEDCSEAPSAPSVPTTAGGGRRRRSRSAGRSRKKKSRPKKPLPKKSRPKRAAPAAPKAAAPAPAAAKKAAGAPAASAPAERAALRRLGRSLGELSTPWVRTTRQWAGRAGESVPLWGTDSPMIF